MGEKPWTQKEIDTILVPYSARLRKLFGHKGARVICNALRIIIRPNEKQSKNKDVDFAKVEITD